MTDCVTLTCPSCGGKLQVTNDLDRFACGFCGNELLVRRGPGTVSLSPVIDSILSVKTGMDKASIELSVLRLQNEIREMQEAVKNMRYRQKKLASILVTEIPLFAVLGFLMFYSTSKILQFIVLIAMLVFLIIVIRIMSKNTKFIISTNKEINAKKGKINQLLKSAQ